MASTTIKVKMAHGGMMELEAEGHLYRDRDGAGESWIAVEDLNIYWPRGSRGKRYQVANKNIANWGQVEEAFVNSFES